MLTVSKSLPADFSSIQSAINSIQNQTEPETIYIKNGVYEERIEITRPNLTFIGENSEQTILSMGYGGNDIMKNGERRGTFRSYTCLVDADNITMENLTIQNSAGCGEIAGQAIALYADGDHLTFKNCRLLGHQDTLFTGPLPPKEIQPGGFIGPKQYAPRRNGRQLYENCFIQGDIDFIFGSATAFFDHCEIFSNNCNKDVNGYVTAPSTKEGQKFGYVFSECRFTSDCPGNTVYLGRPWRNFAQSVFLNCNFGAHIKKEGFHDWNKADSHETTFFATYACYGEGIKNASYPSWVHPLTDSEASSYTRENVLSDKYYTP